ATLDAKADEPGVVAAAAARGWPIVAHPAAALAAVGVPNPSEPVRDAVRTPSVAEAAALLGLGNTALLGLGNTSLLGLDNTALLGLDDTALLGPASTAHLAPAADLVVPKRKSAAATVAVARHAPRGRLALVGLGPGARDLLPPRAGTELRRAAVVVGLDQYVAQVRDLLRPGTRVLVSPLGREEERARAAVEEARRGHAVALVGSGDAGIYAMAGPALALAGDDIDVVGVPGITAALAAAALLGAPLGHDHAVISLSDLHTPWEAIERRVRAAAAGDFVVAFYNPRSRERRWQLPRALDLLAAHRAASTPVGVVADAGRRTQRVTLTTLGGLHPDTVDMTCVVLVGSTNTRVVAGRMVTPRGYSWLPP
ncbi:MAG TPA: precorrin-3B C(17)-methyltransferase, partial [Mycobacteriales bacterium]|nr:precorrin-3B C(17)-methyltransferase [Mycobacteriales bacterium]